MLISMPTQTSAIFGVFQAMMNPPFVAAASPPQGR